MRSLIVFLCCLCLWSVALAETDGVSTDYTKVTPKSTSASGVHSTHRKAKKPFAKKNKLKPRKKVRKGHRAKAKRRRSRVRRYPMNRPKGVDLSLPQFAGKPFKANERLHFNVMMFGQLAGETILAVGKEEIREGQRVLPLAGFLRGSPFLNKFYPINNSLHVWLDTKTYRPQRSEFSVDENLKKMSYTTRYKQDSRQITSLRVKKSKKMRRKHKVVSDVYEPLGCIYAIRAMDLSVGDEFNYYLFDGRKERLVTVKVLGEEDVSVPAGLYRAQKISISTKITGGFVTKAMLKMAPRRGTIWIANDEHRTPLKMIAETKLGPAEALLTKRYFEEGLLTFDQGK